MRIVLHPKVSADADISAIVEYYEEVAGPELADAFYREFGRVIEEAAARPESFSVREREIRRVNLRRFPYHILFRIVDDTFRVWSSVITQDIRPSESGAGKRLREIL